MTASGTTRVLVALQLCVRVLAVGLGLIVLVSTIRGAPLSLERLVSLPGSVSAVLTTSASSDSPAGQRPAGRARLRRQLQELLSHHATLVVRFMRSTVSGEAGFIDAADAVLIRHTADLQTTLEPAIGTDHAAALADGWADNTQALFRYAAALRDDDDAAQQDARQELSSYVDAQATLLADATAGHIDEDMASAGLRMQLDLLLYQIDSYARGDYDQAYELEREAYTHMYPFAAGLASGATGHSPDGVHGSPLEQLTSQLSGMLGAHVELSIDALRAGVAGSDEFAAATAALDTNSRELSATLEGLVGARRSRQLTARWADQIDLLMRYAVAVADHEPSTRRKVRERLRAVTNRFGHTLRAITHDEADVAAAVDALRSQQLLLLDQIEAYAVGDHAAAHDISYSAHHRVHGMAHALAKALIAAMPQGGAQTGGGGTATGA